MHTPLVARTTMQHRHRRVGELEDRALINLPFPIPSIPLLDPILKPLAPLLTPLIDGQHPETRTHTTTTTKPTAHTTSTTPPQAPAPAPTPTSTTPSTPNPTTPSTGDPSPGGGGGSNPPGNGGGGSPSAGGSSGGGSGDSNGGGGGGSSGNSAPASPGTRTTPANQGGGAGAGVGSSPTASGAGAGGDPAASGSGPAVPGTFITDPSAGASGAELDPAAASGASRGSAFGDGGAASGGVVINANGAAFVSGTTAALSPGHTSGATLGGSTITDPANGPAATGGGAHKTAGADSGSPTGSDAGSTSSTTNADPSGPAEATDASVHHGLSVGIIVAICVIVAVLALLFLAFCCRRRAIAKRLRRRRTWFTAGAYAGNDEYRDASGGGGNRSARSSFATHFDRGNIPTPAPYIDLPVSSEEMSQVWPSNMSGSIMLPPASRTVESLPSPTIRAAPDRTSISSLSSGGGSRPPSQSSQYLAAPDPAATEGSPYGLDFPSPFSVRPFSPSETFSFPRPPQDDARSRASGIVGSSIVSGSISSAAFYTAEDQRQSAEHPPLSPAENPFLDFTEVRPPSPAPSSSAPSVEHSSAESANSTAIHFAATETIRRPFVPTMDDEVAVSPGQQVRILRRFDDGWAYAELLGSGTRGLIPIDTLRPVEEDLPAFLAKKRLSSYVGRSRASQRVSALSGTSVGKAISL
ncbi:hypothetical protein C8Q77DRAFT_890897 [Trametes polyzona]|nr:hypothetical protein C8Q77DRAFT_890897 [Trametes polyzona]